MTAFIVLRLLSSIQPPCSCESRGNLIFFINRTKPYNLILCCGCKRCLCSWDFESSSQKRGGHPVCSRSIYSPAQKGPTLKSVYLAWVFRIYAPPLVSMTILSHVQETKQSKWHCDRSIASENLTSPLNDVGYIKIWAITFSVRS